MIACARLFKREGVKFIMSKNGVQSVFRSVFRRTMIFAFLLCSMISTNICVAHAADNIFYNANIGTQLGNLYNIIFGYLGLPVAAVSLLVCGIFIMVGGEKAMEFGRKWGSKLLIAICVLVFLSKLLMIGYDTFKSVQWDPAHPTQNNPIDSSTDASVSPSSVLELSFDGEGGDDE